MVFTFGFTINGNIVPMEKLIKQTFEDTKEESGAEKRGKIHNTMAKKGDKMTNNDLQNIPQKN